MYDDCETLLAELGALSQEMLELAQAGDWQAVIEREKRRRGLIEALFEQSVSPAMTPRLKSCIDQVLDNDAVIMALGQDQMRDITARLEGLSQGRKAQRAYGAHR